MFYRVTSYEFPAEKQAEIADWVQTKTEDVRAIEGLLAVDVFNPAPGQGLIVASYESEDAYLAGAQTIADVLGQLAVFLSGPPRTMSGSPFWTTRVAVSAV